ncbi:DUF11 domain-containing protein [Tenacibaculum maritimum]|uniref:DUF11 domain-containing protein n=1 Tax=Tenacibaculum maritimum TaxID=107401 RepID=UPI0012E40E32|nr:DUF11 domain-containing protein [Tenacibaculum maritimum]CAA0245745.1 conserved hypothetical protein [Tenacibaculum maritimum]
MKRIVIILLFFINIIDIKIYSQTGPGGVGANDGTSNLKVWLRADDINGDGNLSNNPVVGTKISVWNDYSGNANHYTNASTVESPTHTLGVFNAINFDAAAASVQFLNANVGGTYIDASTFFALNPANIGPSNSLFDNGSYSLRSRQWSNTNRIGYTRYGAADYTSTLAPSFGNNAIISYHKQAAATNMELYLNNNTSTINVGITGAGIPYDRIGRNSPGADRASGDFYEVILYNSSLSMAERLIVENYLSAKYGSILIVDNIYNEDEDGDFDHKVAGIGQALDGTNHIDSQGTGIVRINTPNDLQNNEFLLWGEDVENSDYSFSIVAPVNKRHRIHTKWRVSERGDVGTVTFSVKASDINLAGVPAGVLKLVRSTVSDFSTVAQEYNLALSGGVYSATVSFNDNDFFTIEMVPTVDLSLVKKVTNALPKVGDTIIYTLTLKNSGPQEATGVKIRDQLPVGLQYNAGASTISSGTYDAVSGEWDLSGVSIGTGQTVTIQIAAVINSPGVITNTTEVISVDQEDIDATPNNGN